MANDFEESDPSQVVFERLENDRKELESWIRTEEAKYWKKRNKVLNKKNKFRMRARQKRIERLRSRGQVYPQPVPQKGQYPPQLTGGFGTYYPEVMARFPKDHPHYDLMYEGARTLFKNPSYDYSQKKITLRWMLYFFLEYPKTEEYARNLQWIKDNPEVMGLPNKLQVSLQEYKEDYDRIDFQHNPETAEFFDENGELFMNAALKREGKDGWVGYDSPPPNWFAANNPLTKIPEKEDIEEDE